MEITLTNRQVINPDLKNALALLSAKALPASISQDIADLTDFIKEKTLKIEKLQTELLIKCNAVKIPNGYKIEHDNPLFDTCVKERDALLDISFRFTLNPIVLPEFDFTGQPLQLEPVIFSALKPFLPARKNPFAEIA